MSKIKKNATAGLNVNSNNKAVLTMSTSSSCCYMNYFRHPTDEQLRHVYLFFSDYYNLQSVVN